MIVVFVLKKKKEEEIDKVEGREEVGEEEIKRGKEEEGGTREVILVCQTRFFLLPYGPATL